MLWTSNQQICFKFVQGYLTGIALKIEAGDPLSPFKSTLAVDG